MSDSPVEIATTLKEWLKGHRALLGIDYDGTLVPHDPDPMNVGLTPETKELLRRLAVKYPCAIISGRALADIRARVLVPGLSYIGNHGAQMLISDGSLWEWQSERWERWRTERLAVVEKLAHEHGAWIEDKHFSLAVHYRATSDQKWWASLGESALMEACEGTAAVLLPGAQAWNIVPAGGPTKGTAAVKLCRAIGLEAVAHIGDEATDETLFSITEIPVFGIKVGAGETAAKHRVRDTAEVLALLSRLL
jgi:trehalose 6-phosphate phosphatase